MLTVKFTHDITECIKVLSAGGLILYPTDTIWGIGCDATNNSAVEKIYSLKQRPDNKSMIILVADAKEIYKYVDNPNEKIFEYLSAIEKPTTVIYRHAKDLPKNLINNDGSIAIRIVLDDFCHQLNTHFKKPIVSTSANISAEAFPKNFMEISDTIKNGVDYIVQHRQNDLNLSQPSSVIKMNADGEIEIIR